MAYGDVEDLFRWFFRWILYILQACVKLLVCHAQKYSFLLLVFF
jgi:hypothetical protein